MDESGGQSSDANFVELLASDLFFASGWRSVKEFESERRAPSRYHAQMRSVAIGRDAVKTLLDSG